MAQGTHETCLTLAPGFYLGALLLPLTSPHGLAVMELLTGAKQGNSEKCWAPPSLPRLPLTSPKQLNPRGCDKSKSRVSLFSQHHPPRGTSHSTFSLPCQLLSLPQFAQCYFKPLLRDVPCTRELCLFSTGLCPMGHAHQSPTWNHLQINIRNTNLGSLLLSAETARISLW